MEIQILKQIKYMFDNEYKFAYNTIYKLSFIRELIKDYKLKHNWKACDHEIGVIILFFFTHI